MKSPYFPWLSVPPGPFSLEDLAVFLSFIAIRERERTQDPLIAVIMKTVIARLVRPGAEAAQFAQHDWAFRLREFGTR